jgi:hypothetical protein
LQQLVGIVKEILKLVALCPKHLRGKLRGHLDSGHRGVFRHVAYFVDLDAGVACQCGLQLLGERGGLGVAARETAHKTRKLRLGCRGSEMDTGNTRRREQLRKAAFAGG